MATLKDGVANDAKRASTAVQKKAALNANAMKLDQLAICVIRRSANAFASLNILASCAMSVRFV